MFKEAQTSASGWGLSGKRREKGERSETGQTQLRTGRWADDETVKACLFWTQAQSTVVRLNKV